ncbi:MAG TPA: dipeptide epimerase [Rubrivivax sp.]|nr:dipeptide epimerase [Rubrivivax sp.]
MNIQTLSQAPLTFSARPVQWELVEPLVIARGTMTSVDVVIVIVRDTAGRVGQGEAAGVDYAGETPSSMLRQLDEVASRLTEDTTPAGIQAWLPPGGARNALDCALWDLQAKRSGVPAWQRAGASRWEPTLSAMTIGLGSEAHVRQRARALRSFPLLKLKVDADRHVDVVRIVREEHPGARITVDANGGWSRGLLERLLPQLAQLRVEHVEQPVPPGTDEQLDGLVSPIPLVADESCVDRSSLPGLVRRYQGINIKLDKTGGLTEALLLAAQAQQQGLDLMVGNMCGSSLAMAPAFVIGQSCRYVDLDGPLWQVDDIEPRMPFEAGMLSPPEPALWG